MVSPARVSTQLIERFVKDNIRWIERQQEKMRAHLMPSEQNEQNKNHSTLLPSQIYFPLLSKTYQVEYVASVTRETYKINENVVRVFSHSDDEKKLLLQQFVHRIAKTELTLLLNSVSERLALPYNRVFIKAQKTRWGSCSSKKNINLNRNLLFLSPVQVEYLIIHELCHTVHLNHSAQYWQLVADKMPAYQKIDRSLKAATMDVPVWALGL